MKDNYEKRILAYLERKIDDGPVSPGKMKKKFQKKPGFKAKLFDQAMEQLKKTRQIRISKKGVSLAVKPAKIKCEIIMISGRHGFAKSLDADKTYYIPGRYLGGAMPSDIVTVREIRSQGPSPEAKVISIDKAATVRFTGNIVSEFGKLRVLPDHISDEAIRIADAGGIELCEGDKVIAEITERADEPRKCRCRIISDLGSSLKASVCCLSVLELSGITTEFPEEVIAQAKSANDMRSVYSEKEKRLDLTHLPIFTIDGADTKDIDDAISVSKTDEGYELSVHIADVSHYVKYKSDIDNEAFRRGTSVYYADRVVPMLPKELSNGICSLNPNEERLAFSCLMKLDNGGKVTDFCFKKTVIRSRVQGVYSEINKLLKGSRSQKLRKKYAEVIDELSVIKELADKVNKVKKSRNTPEISSVESKLIIDERDMCIGVSPKERGRSEEIIEDFMLLANECAAKFAQKNKLPFVYRIHEPPTAEKLDTLKELLTMMNIPFPVNKEKWLPEDFARLLEDAKGTPQERLINNSVLRTMSKAKYSVSPDGHYGLALADYAHFTSPIRRYPDLTIHRIMSDFLSGRSCEKCHGKYGDFAMRSAESSTDAEIRAMKTERECEDKYKAEFMSTRIGEELDGIISSVTASRLFVSLPDTCEGSVSIEELGEGEYYFDGAATMRNITTGAVYTVGDSIRIIVQNANVNLGRVDFSLAPQ